MKPWILSLFLVATVMAAAENIEEEEPTGIAGKRPGYATRDATVLSMMGWGITIAVAIATFTALVSNHEATPATTP